ncbi:hypothetical protein D514_0106530 [Microbacterium sp. UCD-TDU]|nr:hypothetical protein D514_0106530 [Microbacterium sp. UCD-TDU]
MPDDGHRALDQRGDAMRVNKWGVGVVLATAVLLTGCTGGGSDSTTEKKPSAGASQEAEAPEMDCPELKDGASLDGSVLGDCVADAMSETAGYAATSSVMGIDSTARVNPSDKAIETISPAGSLIVIGDDVWVKSATSDWQAADPSSSDPVIAALSASAADASLLDPTKAADAVTGAFTVTGTGERLGQAVYLLSGTMEQQGTAVEVVFEVTADYVVLASSSSASLEGQTVEVTMEITEWDVRQEIVAPV